MKVTSDGAIIGGMASSFAHSASRFYLEKA
jgi:hypothetical protein